MGLVRLTINGQEIHADSQKSVLQVVREQRLDEIPTLCYDDRLPPYGACFLCVVEVTGRRGLVPACSTKVEEGMQVRTQSEKIVEARRTCLQLILSDHYADCLGPCRQNCPAGVDIQGYISLTRLGKFQEGIRLIKEANPLPSVCGRVCVRKCELACRRQRVDEPVAIDYLKRYLADLDLMDMYVPETRRKNGHKVAVVGGGPAGLSCAYYLACEGCAVTLLDAMPKLGGMLRYGIPEYRMPKAILDREIENILGMGIEVRTEKYLGRDFTIEGLTRDGFEAVFLALGAWRSQNMRVKGEEAKGVVGGIDFLRGLQLESPPSFRGRVVVVGGGNTAIDAARTSLRLGADEVTVLYRRTISEMPAHPMEIQAAEEEGVNFIFLSAPVAVVTENGRATGLECIRMTLGEPDSSGRRKPEPVLGSEYFLHCDSIIAAIGQEPDLAGLRAGFGSLASPEAQKGDRLVVQPSTLSTSIPGVFAGGDVVTGPATVIEAIAHGHRGALAILRYLLLDPALPRHEDFNSQRDIFGELPDSLFEEIPREPRNPMPEIPLAERRKNFQEVELGYSDRAAAAESNRCLECGCNYLYDCRLRQYATQYHVTKPPYLGAVNRFNIDDRHPFIVLNPNKCIKCGRCVRTCAEILDVAALGFLHRGFRTVVKPAMDKPLLSTNCIACGNCIAACPTGAITEKLPYPRQGPWPMDQQPSLCTYCSIGCNLNLRYFDRDLFTISPGESPVPNNGYLCFRGRFGHFYLRDNERLMSPLVRKNGKLREASWDEAMDRVAAGLTDVIHRHGPGATAIFASPKLSNEELYLLKRLALSVLKTVNLSSFSHFLIPRDLNALDGSLGITTSTNPLCDLETADVIFVLNADPLTENPVAGFLMKRRAKNGARLLVASSVDLEFNRHAYLWLDSRKRTNTMLLLGIMRQIVDAGRVNRDFVRSRTEGFDEFCRQLGQVSLGQVSGVTGVSREKIVKAAELISDPRLNVMAVYNIDSLDEQGTHDLKAVANLLLLTGKLGRAGNGLILLREHCNAQGLLDMGIGNCTFPGYEPCSREAAARYEKRWRADLSHLFTHVNADLRVRMEGRDIKACLILGENPLKEPRNSRYLDGVEFLVVQDLYLTETACRADVVLPASLITESTGTFTNCERRIQRFNRVFPARSGLENWQMICQIAERFNAVFPYSSPEDVFREMAELSPFWVTTDPPFASSGGACWNLGTRADGEDFLFAKGFPLPGGKARFQTIETELSVPEYNLASYCVTDEKLRVFREKNLMRAGE